MLIERRAEGRNEVREILSCLRESLGDPAFAGALALLLAQDEHDARRALPKHTGNHGTDPALERQ